MIAGSFIDGNAFLARHAASDISFHPSPVPCIHCQPETNPACCRCVCRADAPVVPKDSRLCGCGQPKPFVARGVQPATGCMAAGIIVWLRLDPSGIVHKGKSRAPSPPRPATIPSPVRVTVPSVALCWASLQYSGFSIQHTDGYVSVLDTRLNTV